MDKKFFFGLVCLCVLTGYASAQSYVLVSGSSLPVNSQSNLMLDYGLSNYDSNLEPGDTGTLTLVVKNTGTQNANNVEVYIPDVPSISLSKRFFVGSVKNGAPTSVSLTYRIAANASIGLHSVPVQLTYDGYDADGSLITNIHSNYDFPIQIYGNPRLTIKRLDMGRAVVGGSVRVSIVIENAKTAAYNVITKLNPGNPLVTIIGSDQVYVGEIGSGRTAEIGYQIFLSDKLVAGAYTIPLVVEYENKGHEKYSETFNLGVYVYGDPKIDLTDVKTDPEKVHPDTENVEVKAKVSNTGTSEVKNLRVTMLPEAPLRNSKSYVQSKELGILRSSSDIPVSFFIDVDEGVKEGVYDLKFLVTYQIDTRVYNETKSVQIVVKGSPDFEVSSSTAETMPGGKGSVKIKVLNRGVKCESVSMWVMKKSDQPFDFSDKSQYIGDLDKNESGEAVMEFSVDDNAKRMEYLVPLEVRCTIDNNIYVSSKSALVRVNGKEGSNAFVYLVVLAVLAAAAYLAYKRFRAKKAGKK